MGEIKRQRDKGTKGQRDKERCLPQPLPKGKGFVAALMHHHVFWGETKSQRDKETESGREGVSLEGCTVNAPGNARG